MTTKKPLPGVEFEGPLGMFYTLDEVEIEALVNGIVELVNELKRRLQISKQEPVTIMPTGFHGSKEPLPSQHP